MPGLATEHRNLICEYVLPWALVSLLHIITAAYVSCRFPTAVFTLCSYPTTWRLMLNNFHSSPLYMIFSIIWFVKSGKGRLGGNKKRKTNDVKPFICLMLACSSARYGSVHTISTVRQQQTHSRSGGSHCYEPVWTTSDWQAIKWKNDIAKWWRASRLMLGWISADFSCRRLYWFLITRRYTIVTFKRHHHHRHRQL